MEDTCKQKEFSVVVATKVKREDRVKLESIANIFGMNLYQLIQGLLLLLLRYFDRQSDISADHETLLKSYSKLIASLKGSFTPIQATSISNFNAQKAILFIGKKKDVRPQMISIGIKEDGALTESYNINEILSDVFNSLDPKLFDDLNSEKLALGHFSLIETLRSLINTTHEERMHEEINNLFTEEIDEIFADLSTETFEELTDTQYRRKHAKTIDGVSSYSKEAAPRKWHKKLYDA